MNANKQNVQQAKHTTEMIVYLVVSPKCGTEHRIYGEEDILASGGIHAIEQELGTESYWFAKVGQVQGEETTTGVVIWNHELTQLAVPPEPSWRTGRLNPALRGSAIEREAYRFAFQSINQLLDGWKQIEEGVIEAYCLKQLRLSSDFLKSLVPGLQYLERVHEVAECTILKYWYDPSWPGPHLPGGELTLAEYSLNIPLQFRRTYREEVLSVEVMPLALC